MWKFSLSTGDAVYAETRKQARDLARWYRTHTDPAVTTTTPVSLVSNSRTCSQCRPGHDRGDGKCERHGKMISRP